MPRTSESISHLCDTAYVIHPTAAPGETSGAHQFGAAIFSPDPASATIGGAANIAMITATRRRPAR